ncbi:DUF2281 domain-containing protein [Chloroflexota bacterium]
MTMTENIQHYVQMLPDSLQAEVLDFVKYLLFKREQETVQEQEELEWSNLSLELAMRGMEDEDTPFYAPEDLQEVFV